MRSFNSSSTFLIVACVAETLAALPTRGITTTMAAVRKAIRPMTINTSRSEKPFRGFDASVSGLFMVNFP